ncbi:HNH endonuclease [Paraburkholderia fungorum]|uniref:HNH endonuclease n=1 Tax=Paraburkholderia fungorum TaxID=134537 RepID=UPI0038B75369
MGAQLQVVDSSKPKRKAISKKTRFEVFKRDSFKCQYCGQCAPDVILNVDHIHPVSKGGDDDLLNYITSCFDCNSGKSDHLLSDDSVVAKQRQQLAELNERREQLEMMLQWRDALKSIDEDLIERICVAWASAAKGWHLNEAGKNDARKLVKKFGVQAVLDAMDVAVVQYFKYDDAGDPKDESINLAWSKIGGICQLSSQPDDVKKLYYARGILRRRVYVNERYVMELMNGAVDGGMDPDAIIECAKGSKNWTEFQSILHTWVE